MSYRTILITYLRPLWLRVLALSVLLLTSIGLQLVNPQILRQFIDLAREGRPVAALIQVGLIFLGVALGGQLVSVAETYMASGIGLAATNRMRADLTLHCLTLDLSFHNARTPGELIERIDGDVATLGNFFSRFVVYLLGNTLLLLATFVLLFAIDWRVGSALLLFAMGALAVMYRLRHMAEPYWATARQASASLFGFIEERLAGTEDIRANGAVVYVMRRLAERSRELLWRELKARMLGSTTYNISLVLFALGVATSLGMGSYLFQAGAITLGTVYLIYRYTELIQQPIEQINRQLQDLQVAGASLRRVQALFAEQSALVDGDASLPPGALAVEFDHVSFGYESETPTVADITFRLAPGTVMGLLGRTGSGKTTLTRLLCRLYDSSQGEVRLGGRDVREYQLADLRRGIGMVTQEIQLFHASVRDNLTFFDPTIADERILAALRELGLWEWYTALPAGLDTRLASGGGLSAGEAQLLAFVRVFLKDPGLIILDEASSRLDPATEQRLERAMDRLLEGRTAIIIAHRLQTVQRADVIMILEAGRTREFGARDALAHTADTRFAQLLHTGMEDFIA